MRTLRGCSLATRCESAQAIRGNNEPTRSKGSTRNTLNSHGADFCIGRSRQLVARSAPRADVRQGTRAAKPVDPGGRAVSGRHRGDERPHRPHVDVGRCALPEVEQDAERPLPRRGAGQRGRYCPMAPFRRQEYPTRVSSLSSQRDRSRTFAGRRTDHVTGREPLRPRSETGDSASGWPPRLRASR
jgi:hypothetical protein